MYSQQELDDAVASGVITADAADALRAYIEQQRSTVIPDEEQFRLLTGFNDIFVSIAAAILLFAVGWIGQSAGQASGLFITDHGETGPSLLAPLAVAATSWGLALFFTARRRMALPSILLLLSFVGGVLVTTGFGLVQIIGSDRLNESNQLLGYVIGAVSAAVAAIAAWVHWRRFHVPVTVAAGAAALAGLFLAIVLGIAQPQDGKAAEQLILSFMLPLGVGVFLFAMWWDASDRGRVTRRSDVAFWLHLLAAPMIAHPIFALLGLNTGSVTHERSAGGRRPVHLVRANGPGSRPPRLAGLRARLRALRPDRAVQAVRRGRAQRRADGADHRFGAAAAVGILASGAAAGRHPASLNVAGAPAEPRPAGSDLPNQPHKPPLERGQHTSKVVAPLEHRAMFTDQGKRPLLHSKRGAFLDADLGPLGMARGRRQTPPRRDRSAAHNRANGRPRPSARKGRGCASVLSVRTWRSGAGPKLAGTAR